MERIIYERMKASEQTHWWFTARREILSSTIASLNLPAEARILEVGCGTGGNLEMLRQFGTVDAIEPDDDARAYANETGMATVAFGLLPDQLPFEPGTYDLVVALDVIEHVDEDRGTIEAIGKMARPGGYLLTTVPAGQWMWSVHDEQHHHKRRYSLSNYVEMFDGSGLITSKATYFNTFLFGPIAGVRLIKKVLGITSADEAAGAPAGLNRILERVFGAERHWLKRGSFPFGVSIMTVSQRPGQASS